MSPRNHRVARRHSAPTTPQTETLRSIADTLAPDNHYLFGMLRHYLQDLSAIIWFDKNRPGRSQLIDYLAGEYLKDNPSTKDQLSTPLNCAPFETIHYSLRKVAGTASSEEKLKFLLRHWRVGERAKHGRGKLCPNELHHKIIVMAFTLALLDHLGRKKITSRNITELAAALYQAMASHENPWSETPYNSWRKYLAKAKQEIRGGKLAGQYRLWLTVFDQTRSRGRAPFSFHDLDNLISPQAA